MINFLFSRKRVVITIPHILVGWLFPGTFYFALRTACENELNGEFSIS